MFLLAAYSPLEKKIAVVILALGALLYLLRQGRLRNHKWWRPFDRIAEWVVQAIVWLSVSAAVIGAIFFLTSTIKGEDVWTPVKSSHAKAVLGSPLGSHLSSGSIGSTLGAP